MTAPSVLSNFAWTVATPLSGGTTGVMPSQADTSADSFQNIFANAAAAPQSRATNPAPSDHSSPVTDVAACRTKPATTTTEETPSETQTAIGAVPSRDPHADTGLSSASSSASASGSTSSPVAATRGEATAGAMAAKELAGEQASGSPLSSSHSCNPVTSDSSKTIDPSLVRNSQVGTKQVGAKADKRADQVDNPNRPEPSGGNKFTTSVSEAAVPGGTGRAPEAAAGNRAAVQAGIPVLSSNIQQTGRATDVMEKTGSPPAAIPNGLSALPGAAFALRVTSTGSHSDAMPKTASAATPSKGPVEVLPRSVADAAPTESIPDRATLVGGFTNSVGLPVSATLVANSGATRSRQVSAIGASLDSADSAPWSAPTSSPALLNDRAQPAESVAATAPVAEIDAEDPTGFAQPVRTLQLQLGGTADQRVDLRLVEHAGGLSVSVRASDSSLTRGLQENLPELSSRLAAEHYQTQTWLPAAGQTSFGGHSPGSSEQSPEQRGGRQFSQGGSSPGGGQGNSQQQGRQQDQRPAWFRQLAALDGAAGSVSTSVPNSTPSSAAYTVSKQ